MQRALINILNPRRRQQAYDLLTKVPWGTRVEFKAARRSSDQNSKMWAMLTDIARQIEWHGRRLRPEDWKFLFLDALVRETDVVPNLDGDGVVNLRYSSSDLSKQEMGDLIELITAFGANHGIEWGNEQPQNDQA
jgi:hypothetical protein